LKLLKYFKRTLAVTGASKLDAQELFLKCLDQATVIVKQFQPNMLANATPDTDWSVRDLLGHIMYELVWVPDVLSGATVEEVGNKYERDLFSDEGGDLITKWQAASDAAEQAVEAVDVEETAHLSYGDVTMEKYLQQAASDQFIHAWDLAKGIGVQLSYDPALAQVLYDQTLPLINDLEGSGLFAKQLQVSDDATIQTKLLALFGRDANWQAT
jgi:uncharacterized protein (TIGR03086 family)